MSFAHMFNTFVAPRQAMMLMMLMMLASGGAAGRLKCAIKPNKTLTIHAVGTVCGSMPFLVPLLGFLTPPGLNQAKMGSQLR